MAKKTATKAKASKAKTTKKAAPKRAPQKAASTTRRAKSTAAEAPKRSAKTGAPAGETANRGAVEPAPPAAPSADVETKVTKRICAGCLRPITDHAPTCVAVAPTPIEVAATKDQLEARESARVCRDHNNRTCIELRREKEGEKASVVYIPLVDGPFEVERLGAWDFDHKYKAIDAYPVERCAKLYAGYSTHLGATEEAIGELERLVNVAAHEKEKAMAKRPGIATATKTGKKDAVVEKDKAEMKGTKAPAAKAAKKSSDGGERESFASECKKLIMEGKQSDEAIFKACQKKFPGKGKPNYVAWYRNALKKEGKKPPAAKAA